MELPVCVKNRCSSLPRLCTVLASCVCSSAYDVLLAQYSWRCTGSSSNAAWGFYCQLSLLAAMLHITPSGFCIPQRTKADTLDNVFAEFLNWSNSKAEYSASFSKSIPQHSCQGILNFCLFFPSPERNTKWQVISEQTHFF